MTEEKDWSYREGLERVYPKCIPLSVDLLRWIAAVPGTYWVVVDASPGRRLDSRESVEAMIEESGLSACCLRSLTPNSFMRYHLEDSRLLVFKESSLPRYGGALMIAGFSFYGEPESRDAVERLLLPRVRQRLEDNYHCYAEIPKGGTL